MSDVHKEFQRVFEFTVKHGAKNDQWTNADRKKFLRWSWDKRHLLVVYDGEEPQRRIAAAAIVWRTDHPENLSGDFSDSHTGEGDYLHVYHAIVHPEYRGRGCMLLLLALAIQEHPGVKKAFWSSHARGVNKLRIMDIHTLGRELLKVDYKVKKERV